MAKPSSGNDGFGPLNGRVAVVTGAAQGLGAAFAQALARDGASVVAGDVASTAATCAAIEASGGNALGVSLDIDPASIGEWDRVQTVNVRGTFECIKAVAPVMKQRGYGKMFNLSSGTTALMPWRLVDFWKMTYALDPAEYSYLQET